MREKPMFGRAVPAEERCLSNLHGDAKGDGRRSVPLRERAQSHGWIQYTMVLSQGIQIGPWRNLDVNVTASFYCCFLFIAVIDIVYSQTWNQGIKLRSRLRQSADLFPNPIHRNTRQSVISGVFLFNLEL
ncbi:uncharacterized protein ARMOST_22103 [Armillaria ostoyae]|uniref:Uncharacterized protein n=1 Tax=Armillaria ostoyae TaxID=47428 RepID=A0A284SBY7_ARMOS|nr:uncharacterized protein ARMOST_22103 [Armillaria ostoyae]